MGWASLPAWIEQCTKSPKRLNRAANAVMVAASPSNAAQFTMFGSRPKVNTTAADRIYSGKQTRLSIIGNRRRLVEKENTLPILNGFHRQRDQFLPSFIENLPDLRFREPLQQGSNRLRAVIAARCMTRGVTNVPRRPKVGSVSARAVAFAYRKTSPIVARSRSVVS